MTKNLVKFGLFLILSTHLLAENKSSTYYLVRTSEPLNIALQKDANLSNFAFVSALIKDINLLDQEDLLLIQEKYSKLEKTLLEEQTKRFAKKMSKRFSSPKHYIASFLAYYELNLFIAGNEAWNATREASALAAKNAVATAIKEGDKAAVKQASEIIAAAASKATEQSDGWEAAVTSASLIYADTAAWDDARNAGWNTCRKDDSWHPLSLMAWRAIENQATKSSRDLAKEKLNLINTKLDLKFKLNLAKLEHLDHAIANLVVLNWTLSDEAQDLWKKAHDAAMKGRRPHGTRTLTAAEKVVARATWANPNEPQLEKNPYIVEMRKLFERRAIKSRF